MKMKMMKVKSLILSQTKIIQDMKYLGNKENLDLKKKNLIYPKMK